MTYILLIGDIGFPVDPLRNRLDADLIVSVTESVHSALAMDCFSSVKMGLIDIDSLDIPPILDGIRMMKRQNPALELVGYATAPSPEIVSRGMAAGLIRIEPKIDHMMLTATLIEQRLSDLDLFGRVQGICDQRQWDRLTLHTTIASTILKKRYAYGQAMSFDELCALLPVMASNVHPAQEALGSDLEDISPTVLVLEDEDSLRDMICYGFDILNCQPVQSASIGDATTLIRSLTKLDIAVLDIGLPDGLGSDLIQLIRDTHPNASIVMLTAFKDLELIMGCFNKGAVDYLIKPFDVGKFNTTFGHILYRQRVKQFALMMKIGTLPREIPSSILDEYSRAVADMGVPDGIRETELEINGLLRQRLPFTNRNPGANSL